MDDANIVDSNNKPTLCSSLPQIIFNKELKFQLHLNEYKFDDQLVIINI